MRRGAGGSLSLQPQQLGQLCGAQHQPETGALTLTLPSLTTTTTRLPMRHLHTEPPLDAATPHLASSGSSPSRKPTCASPVRSTYSSSCA